MANKFKNGDILRVKVDNITEWTWAEGFKSESFSNQNSQIYGGYMPEEFFELATAEQQINTYGFKIGDVIDGKIFNAWCQSGPNETTLGTQPRWAVQSNPWGDESFTISEFRVVAGHTGIGRGARWVRAEGFKDFIEVQSAPPMPASAYFDPKGTYYSLYPGFEFSSAELTAWTKEGLHECRKGNWCNDRAGWSADHTISTFKMQDGKIAFHFQGSEGSVCFQAEGFYDHCMEMRAVPATPPKSEELPFDPQGSYYGLSVGDTVYAGPLNAWGWEHPLKNERNDKDTEWCKPFSHWSDKKYKIGGFRKFSDSTIGFHFQGLTELFTRAEGFVQFCEEYRRSKSVFPVEQITEQMLEAQKLRHAEDRKFQYPLTQQQAVGGHTRRDNFRPTVHTEDEVVVKVDFNDKSYLSDPMNQEFKVTVEEDENEFQRSRNHQKLFNFAKNYGSITVAKGIGKSRPIVNPEEDDLPF